MSDETKKLKLIIVILVGIILIGIVGVSGFLLGRKGQTQKATESVSTDANVANQAVTPEPTPVPVVTPAPTPTPAPTISPEESKYQKAKSFYKKKKYAKAIKLFKQIKGYKSSKKYIKKCETKQFKQSKCKMGSWQDTTVPYKGGDGVCYTISWSKVSGASGYQVKVGSKEGEWYPDDIIYQTSRSYSIAFSSLQQIRAQVRPYKDVSGKRIYGKWSGYVYKSITY